MAVHACAAPGSIKTTQDEREGEDVPSTVVFRRANSGSASLNARISVGQTKVKSLVQPDEKKNKKSLERVRWMAREEFGTCVQRVEHQDHPEMDTSEKR